MNITLMTTCGRIEFLSVKMVKVIHIHTGYIFVSDTMAIVNEQILFYSTLIL